MKKQLLSKAALCFLCLGAILTACEKKPAPTQVTPMPVDITNYAQNLAAVAIISQFPDFN